MFVVAGVVGVVVAGVMVMGVVVPGVVTGVIDSPGSRCCFPGWLCFHVMLGLQFLWLQLKVFLLPRLTLKHSAGPGTTPSMTAKVATPMSM